VSKPENIDKYNLKLTTTPWLWTNTPLDNSLSIREIHRLWELPESPLTPKRWDIYYDTKKRKLFIYETRRRIYARDKFSVDWWITGNQYYKWDYIETGPFLYVCVNDHVSTVFPDPANWERTNVIRRWTPLEVSDINSWLWWNQSISSWVRSKLNYNNFASNRWDELRNATDIVIDNWWLYDIIMYTHREQDTTNMIRQSRLLVNWTPIQYSIANSSTVTVSTTGTDSVGWAISATSTVSYPDEETTNHISMITRLFDWDIITVESFHNKWSNTSILQDSYLHVTQI